MGGFRNYIKSVAVMNNLAGQICRTRGSCAELILYGSSANHYAFSLCLDQCQNEVTLIQRWIATELVLLPGLTVPNEVVILPNDSSLARRGTYSDELAHLDRASKSSSDRRM